MVPEEWITTDLNSVAKVIDCKHRTPAYVDEGIPLVSPGTIKWGPLDLTTPTKRVTLDEYTSLMDHCVIEIGDLVFSRNQSVGVASRVVSRDPFVLGQDTVLIKPGATDKTFLYYKLQSNAVQRRILKLAGGSTFSRINLSDIRRLRLDLPPLPEQKKIAQILSTWDKAIATTEKLLANSQQQKKALMQQLLTSRKRLLDRSGEKVGDEWRYVRLGEVFCRVTTKNLGQSTNVVTISGQHGLIRQEDFFKKSVASETLDGYFLLRKGQFAYNKSYSNGYPMGAIKRLNRYDDGVVTTLYICFEVADRNRVDGGFFEHYFESGLLNKGLSQIAHEGGRAHGLLNVKPADFFSLRVPLPSLEEQQCVAAVLASADRAVQVQESTLCYLKKERQSLMQQLLSGRCRVKIGSEAAQAGKRHAATDVV